MTTTPTPAQCAEWTTDLADYKAALKAAISGKKVESMQDGEKQLSYSRIDIDTLRATIADLQGKVDRCNGCARNTRRVLHVLPMD